VTTRGRDGKGALAELLAADVGEVDVVFRCLCKCAAKVAGGGFDFEFFGQKANGLGERGDGDNVDVVDDGGFVDVVARGDDAGEAFVAREDGHAEHALDGANATIEGEFAGDHVLLRTVGDGVVGAEDLTEGDGEVERGALLTQVGRGKVDERAMSGRLIAAVVYRGADTLAAFLNAGVGQADDLGFGETHAADVDFDFAGQGLDADEGETVEMGKHGGNTK